MKKLYYNYAIPDIEELDISEFLVECSPSTSSWFNSLDFFINGAKDLNEYFSIVKRNILKGLQSYDEINSVTTPAATTIKNCPGIKGLFRNTILVKSPCDLHVSVLPHNNNFEVLFNSSDQRLMIGEWHDDGQFKSRSNGLFNGAKNLKLCLPIVLQTDVDYLMLDPMYHENLPWKTMTGVINAREYNAVQLNINVMLQETECDFIIKKGAPLCYLYFHDKVKLERKKNIEGEHLDHVFLNRNKYM